MVVGRWWVTELGGTVDQKWMDIKVGGLGPDNYPSYLYHMLARNIDPGKWQNICYSYSTSLQIVHMYQNGAKVFGYHYNEEKHDPLPPTLFEKVILLRNFRGMFTDLQILDTFSTEEKLIELSTQCDPRTGKIFSWERKKLKTVRISLTLIIPGYFQNPPFL